MSLMIKVLGAGQHVGKSCNLIHLNNVNVLVDCGIQITKYGNERFPDLPSLFYKVPGTTSTDSLCVSMNPPQSREGTVREMSDIQEPPWKRQKLAPSHELPRHLHQQNPLSHETCLFPSSQYSCQIDAVLITHFHLDHIGALPFLTEVLGYRGPIFMTQTTLELSRLLLHDCWCKSAFRGPPPSRLLTFNEKNGDREHQTDKVRMNETLQLPFTCRLFSNPPTSNLLHNDKVSHSHEFPANDELILSSNSTSLFFGDVPLTAESIESCLSRVTTIPLDHPIQVGPSQVHITAISAGHVAGAVMFQIEDLQSGHSVLYTGDYTIGAERLFRSAKIPPSRSSVVITESTYGGQVRDSKKATEQDLCIIAEEVVRRGGKVLIPIGGIGKAQEIAVLLNDHWNRYGVVDVPIVLGSGMIEKGMEKLKSLDPSWSCLEGNNRNCISTADVKTVLTQYAFQPLVYLSPPKTMDSGASFEVLKAWANDTKNMILLPSYSVPGTIACQVLNGQRQIKIPHSQLSSIQANSNIKEGSDGVIELKASFRYFSIASHSDSIGIQSFLKYTAPLISILVHGEINGMRILSANLRKAFQRPVHCPKNNEVTVIQFPSLTASPANIRRLYYYECHAASAQPANQMKEKSREDNSGTKEFEACSMHEQNSTMTLKKLLERNVAKAESWITRRTKTTPGVHHQQQHSSAHKRSNIDGLILDLCPTLFPLLESSIMLGCPGKTATTSILKSLETTGPFWVIEDCEENQMRPAGVGKNTKQKVEKGEKIGKNQRVRKLGKERKKHMQRMLLASTRDPAYFSQNIRARNFENSSNLEVSPQFEAGEIRSRDFKDHEDEHDGVEEGELEEGELG